MKSRFTKPTSCEAHPSISLSLSLTLPLYLSISHSVRSPPVWLHHHLRGSVPAGAPAGSAQQHHRDPPGRLQVRHSVEETHAGPGDRHRSASSPPVVPSLHLERFQRGEEIDVRFSIAICRRPIPHMNRTTHKPPPAVECMATWLSWRFACRLEERIKKMQRSRPAKANWPRPLGPAFNAPHQMGGFSKTWCCLFQVFICSRVPWKRLEQGGRGFTTDHLAEAESKSIHLITIMVVCAYVQLI